MAPRVVITLSDGALAGLDEALLARGLQVERQPLLRAAPPESWEPVDVALAQLAHYVAVAVTSPRAAVALVERMAVRGVSAAATPAWAVGERSAAPLRTAFAQVHVVRAAPGDDAGAAETLAGAMLAAGVRGSVLFPCGDLRRDALPQALAAAGCRVDEACCYRSVLADAAMARTLVQGSALVVVGSPSVAQLLAGALLPADRPLLLALGPTTADAAREAGWPADAVADAPLPGAVADACLSLLTVDRIVS